MCTSLRPKILSLMLPLVALVPQPVKASQDLKVIPMEELGKHGTKTDCWVIIEGYVYNVTAYIDQHPAPEELLVKGCGKDVSIGWQTKGPANKPHSKKAALLLKKYLVGKAQS